MVPAATAAISITGMQQTDGHLIAPGQHAASGSAGAHQHLTLRAQVPELHLEGRGHGQRDAEQQCRFLHGDPNLAGGTEAALEHRDVYLNGVITGDEHDQSRADQHGQHDGRQTDEPGLPPDQIAPLGDANQRFAVLFAVIRGCRHCCSASVLVVVINRPICSLVALRASVHARHAAAADDQDAIAQLEQHVEILAHADHRHAAFLLLAEQIVNHVGRVDIQSAHGIGRHQHGGRCGNFTADEHLLHVSARQPAHGRGGAGGAHHRARLMMRCGQRAVAPCGRHQRANWPPR